MNQEDRAVAPVIATILMVAVVVILAAVLSVAVLEFREDINEPAPNVADTTGEFQLEATPENNFQDNQIVQVTHISGESVAVEELEIVVRASGPDLSAEARLVDLPANGINIDDDNIIGDPLISTTAGEFGAPEHDKIIVTDDTNTWSASDTIQFRIKTGIADFRPEKDPEADELEVIIVHTPSNAILSEHTFTP